MENIHHQQGGYFTLIERVGSKGKYQRQLLLLFYSIWFITAFLILSMPFMFMSSQYHCPDIKKAEQCKKWVCSLPQLQKTKYMQQSAVHSLVHQLSGCKDESDVVNYKMALFAGILLGYIIFSYFSDNFGRRKAMVFSWATTLLGLIILCFSKSLTTVAVGLFLAGAGCQSNLRVNLSIINEIVDYHLRQIYSITLQSAFGVAGVSIAGAYYWLTDWRSVTIFFCGIPAVIVMILILLRVQQTPAHLSAKGSKSVLQSLQRIAAINGLECIITEQQVQQAILVRIQNDKINSLSVHKLTLFDLFRFQSLKSKTIYLSLMLFFLASLYIGPNSVLQSFNVDVFWLQVILSIPDCIVYPLTCHYIVNIQRRKGGIRSLGLCSIILFASIFVNPPSNCNFCLEIIMKLVLIFFSRCCVSFYYGVLFLYIIQLYPQQIRNIGFGTVSVFGAFGSTLVQKILSYSTQFNHNPLVYLFIFCLVCFFASFKLPETHGQILQFEIEQLRKKRINKRYQPSLQQSFADLQLSSQSAQSERPAAQQN